MPMTILRIDNDPERTIASLFAIDEEGLITFGLTARSIEPTSLQQLEIVSVKFKDFVMEGGVKFGLQLDRIGQALQLNIELAGTARDKYVISQIKFYISQAGYKATEVSTVN